MNQFTEADNQYLSSYGKILHSFRDAKNLEELKNLSVSLKDEFETMARMNRLNPVKYCGYIWLKNTYTFYRDKLK